MGSGNAILLKGDLHVDLLDASGAQTGQRTRLNANPLTLTPPTAEEITQQGFGDDNYGDTLDSYDIPGAPAQISFETDSFPRDMWDAFFAGDSSTLTQAADTGVAFTITAKLGKWVPLGNDHVQLSNLSVTTPVSMTEGTDYEIDYAGARFRALTDGGISDEATVSGTYDHAAVTGTTVKGGKYTNRKVYLYLKGTLLTTGERVLLDCWEVNARFGEISPIGTEFMRVSVEGSMITPTGKDSPYRIRAYSA